MTTLSVALGNYPHTAPLRDGSVSVSAPKLSDSPLVKPDMFELDFVEIDGSIIQAFRRMVRGLEFDVSEMAITTYLSALDRGKPLTAIPVFPVRGFPHGALAVNGNAGIATPKDLEGKRVGVRAYTVTTGVWARAVLADQYGVDLDKITWVIADEEHVQEVVLPDNVESLPGADLGAMVSSGELAAGIGVTRPDTANVRPLIDDIPAKEREWADKGIYPINHTIVIKNEIIDNYRGFAAGLYKAFVEAKRPFSARLAAGGELSDDDKVLANRRELVGPDPVPYGIEANRDTLEAIVAFARNQHILSTDLDVEEMFVPGFAQFLTAAPGTRGGAPLPTA
jgi:4,5-dihydroxyphthalate decarboxylase